METAAVILYFLLEQLTMYYWSLSVQAIHHTVHYFLSQLLIVSADLLVRGLVSLRRSSFTFVPAFVHLFVERKCDHVGSPPSIPLSLV